MVVAERVWSSYQEAIYHALEHSTDSLVIEAVAGSGKTSTLVECAHRLTEYDNSCALAFNTRIKDELVKRLPAYCPALTLNALGNRAWVNHVGKRVPVDSHKITTLIRSLSDDSTPDYRKGVKRLVDLAKTAGIVPTYIKEPTHALLPDTTPNWESLIEEYGISFGWGDRWARAIELGRRVLAESIRIGGQSIDFNDQLYLPVVFGSDFTQYDILFVDEAQDLSAIQHVMVERSVSAKGRVIAFGDRGQGIYQFRGAGKDSIPQLQKRFGARALPLSISYRCSRAVVRYAKQYQPQIEPADEAPEGSVTDCASWKAEDLRSTDAVLCRNNAPLVKLAFRLLRGGRPCKVLGRDIGSGLVSLVQRLRAGTIRELAEKLNDFVVREMTSITDRPDQVAALMDRADTLRVFMENASTPAEVVAKIEGLFADDATNYLTLSSAHKAKGCEWPRVWILDFHLIGARATTDYERQAENNVAYVAVTRAQKDLFFIRS